MGWGPALLEVLNTHLLMGSRELIPWFAWLVGAAFAFPIKWNLSQSMSHPDATLLLWGVSERP